MSQTAALYTLQTLDSQSDAIRKRLSEIAALIEQNEALLAAQAVLAEAEQSHLKWQTRQTELELERATLQEESKATEDRLYSGQVPNPRELTDLQEKLAELGRRRESLEEPILEAMLAVEEGQHKIQEARATLERVSQEQTHTLADLRQEQATLSARLEALLPEIEHARAQVEPRSLEIYDRLRRRPGGLVVAKLRDDECSMCGVELTSQQAQQVRRGELLTCPTCGRILHFA